MLPMMNGNNNKNSQAPAEKDNKQQQYEVWNTLKFEIHRICEINESIAT
jgi:hypothetical protein